MAELCPFLSQAIIGALGAERRNRVLSGLYMGRSDTQLVVRQASLHVWKIVVSNTPRTLREILPTLFGLLLGFLASTCPDKRTVTFLLPVYNPLTSLLPDWSEIVASVEVPFCTVENRTVLTLWGFRSLLGLWEIWWGSWERRFSLRLFPSWRRGCGLTRATRGRESASASARSWSPPVKMRWVQHKHVATTLVELNKMKIIGAHSSKTIKTLVFFL